MILKLTVHDNDFSEDIEEFANDIMFCPVCDGEASAENAIEDYHVLKVFRGLWSAISNGETLTDEEKDAFLIAVKRKFEYFCKKHFGDVDEYVIGNFEAQLLDNLAPKWENGESVYIFICSSGGQHITL